MVYSASTPWMPYQNRSGWCGSKLSGPLPWALVTLPTPAFVRSLAIDGWNREHEELKNGTPAALDSRTISRASARDAVKGLSMNTGLPALKAGRACRR